MFRIILYIFFIHLFFSQHVIGESILIGVDYNGSYTAIFEDVVNAEDNTETTTYRANGVSLGAHLTYQFNNHSSFLFKMSKKSFDLTHNSSLIANEYDTAVKNVTLSEDKFSKEEYYSYQFMYFKRFYPKKFKFGVGLAYNGKINHSDSTTYIQGTKNRLSGIVSLGADFGSSNFTIYPYIQYMFPITKYKEEGISKLNLSEFALGLRLSFKLF